MLRPRARHLATALLLASVASLPACLERKQTGALNPDGSGKITMETFVPLPPAEPGGPPAPDALAYAKQVATQIVQTSRGIDAWSNLSYDRTPDGRAHVVGTCYFSDINKLQLDNPIPFSWTRDANGNYTLSLKAETGQAPPGQPPMTDAQVAAAVSQGKAQYADFKPMLNTTLSTLKVDASLTLPGKIAQSNVFNVSGNTVTLSFDGKQVLNAMDKIMSDDKALADAIRAGRQPDADQNMLLEQIFSKKGPVSATVTGANAPQFDYRTEMSAAKAAQAQMYQRLGIDPTPPPMPQVQPGMQPGMQGGQPMPQGQPMQPPMGR